MDPLFTIRLRTHHFLVESPNHRVKGLCSEYAAKFVYYKTSTFRGRIIKTPDCVYAAAARHRGWYRFHINTWSDFELFLEARGIAKGLYLVVDERRWNEETVEIGVKSSYEPRPYQIPYVNYLSDAEGPISRLVGLQPGDGKGIISMFGMAAHSRRVVVIVLPRFMGKWRDELIQKTTLEKSDIVNVNGSKQLKDLLAMKEGGHKLPKVTILSNRTYQDWLSAYEKDGEDLLSQGYACTPDTFYEHMGYGIRLIDEVHMHFHACFRSDLYTNGAICFNLSATLLNKERFMVQMYELMLPSKWRIADREVVKYVNVHALHYQLKDPDRVVYNERGSSMYSHNAFEVWLCKRDKSLETYLGLIERCIEAGYINNTREKKRMIVYLYRTDLVAYTASVFQKRYPQLNVKFFVAEQPIENLLCSDLCFTTLGSAGTALDIPDLVSVCCTVAVGSQQLNVQAMGRLRRLDDNPDLNFYYFVCDDVPAHVSYHRDKRLLFAGRAKAHTDWHTSTLV